MTTPTRVIIDTDTGVDDGIGLIYGLISPELDVVAVTTSFGNVDVEKVTRNSTIIVEQPGSTSPLAKGASRELSGELPVFNPEIHGDGGLGNTNLTDPSYSNGHRRLVAVVVHGLSVSVAPCAGCRQVLAEFAEKGGVVAFSREGEIVAVKRGDLLPFAFMFDGSVA